ncbi:MAG: molybdopterin adenylyltransferase [bacterium]
MEHGDQTKDKILSAILTISDRSFFGEREDSSGPIIHDVLQKINSEVIFHQIVPDEKDIIEQKLIELSDSIKVDLIITTGGTGLSPRDVTPEATLEIIDKRVPGLEEAMRAESMKITPHGMLSRAVAGVRGRTLIVNLPGSPKAVKENLSVILLAIPHAIDILKGKKADG